jgi:hypothetical protein
MVKTATITNGFNSDQTRRATCSGTESEVLENQIMQEEFVIAVPHED